MSKLDSPVEEIIYTHAPDYFDRVIHAIESAQHSVEMEVYLFDDDLIGSRVTQALSEAAQRGISVKLLTDGVGICSNFYQIADKLNRSGVQLKIHRPLPWRFELWPFSLATNQGLQKFWYLLSFINQRDHRKLLMIDHKTVLLGSFNVSQTHLPEKLGGKDWRDTAIEIKGIDTRNIQTAFNACWLKSRKKKTAVQLTLSPFIFNFTRALRLRKRASLLKRIETAEEKIWLTNAYFLPDAKFLKSLLIASERGVDVRIVLPKHSDVFFIPWASSYFYSHLLNAGARLYEYQKGILHAKTILVDDWACVGSSNLNQRSLMHDLELDYSIQLEVTKQQLALDVLDDIKDSEELDPDNWDQNRLWQRLLGGLLLVLLAYWV